MCMYVCVCVCFSWKEIAREIVSIGYKLYWKMISTREHGIPQSRPRVYIVAIRSDSLLKELKWPDDSPMKPIATFLNKGSKRKRKLGKVAKAVLKKALSQIVDAGGNPQKEFWMIDVCASDEWASWSKDCSPCVTRSRGPNGFWITHKDYNGMMTVDEVMALQGFDAQRMQWEKSGLSKTAFGHALGDAMSMNVLKKVLRSARIAAGLSTY
jgi:hypothetical protein